MLRLERQRRHSPPLRSDFALAIECSELQQLNVRGLERDRGRGCDEVEREHVAHAQRIQQQHRRGERGPCNLGHRGRRETRERCLAVQPETFARPLAPCAASALPRRCSRDGLRQQTGEQLPTIGCMRAALFGKPSVDDKDDAVNDSHGRSSS